MKIYTKTGDQGETSLFNGQRIPKDSLYLESYGTVDELNTHLGVALSLFQPSMTGLGKLHGHLQLLQGVLFEVGADLATPLDAPTKVKRITEADIQMLEAWIDDYDNSLPPLRSFILPGGAPIACQLHVSRTVARRAERAIFGLLQEGKTHGIVLKWVNRLSDYLFTAARFANYGLGTADTPWMNRG